MGHSKTFLENVNRVRNRGFPAFADLTDTIVFVTANQGFLLLIKSSSCLKIGCIRVVQHRSIAGKIKTCTIRGESGKWYACFSGEVEANVLPSNERSVGIDLWIENFAILSDGQKIANPRFFKSAEKDLAKAQKKLSKLEKGSAARKKQKKVVARVHERVRNKRSDFCHRASRRIVNEYQYICVEDLNVSKMM